MTFRDVYSAYWTFKYLLFLYNETISITNIDIAILVSDKNRILQFILLI